MTSTSGSKQLEILQCINDYVNRRGYPPTVREICDSVNLSSTSTVHGHLSRLEKKGYIFRDPAKPRAIEITSSGLEAIGETSNEMPLLGVVTAGEPILAVEQATDYFPVPPNINNDGRPLFMLTIRGESMINAGILDGDQVIVRKQDYASNGEIVIAMTEENEATCKRFYKEDGYIRLQPENDTLDPLIFDNISILGKVVGLYRPTIY
ncbi:transcriptional repressor LexA [Companilactobacillus sp. DQM5]|uniref:transcriptional repressor LexA n=1 Tax=Companilactobacillus sp. DQM5 TaxID=3463359 RepID=UPI004058C0CC